MKWLGVIGGVCIGLGVVGHVFSLSSILLFITVGLIPGTNTYLAPSTMLAIMVASAVMLPFVAKWRDVVAYSGHLYDSITKRRRRNTLSLPKRRFGRI